MDGIQRRMRRKWKQCLPGPSHSRTGLLTAGLAYWEYFVGLIKSRVSFLAPVLAYPGENELESLALGALRVLRKEEELQNYDAQTA